MHSMEAAACDPKASGVLSESNRLHFASSEARLRLSHISASCARRRELLQRRQRQEKIRRRKAIRRIEYQRLRCMVPSIAQKKTVSKVTVIEEAIRYIDYLHGALLMRLKTKGLPSCLREAELNVDVNHLTLDGIKGLVCQLIERKQGATPTSPLDVTLDDDLPTSVFEKSRSKPSFPKPPQIRKRT